MFIFNFKCHYSLSKLQLKKSLPPVQKKIHFNIILHDYLLPCVILRYPLRPLDNFYLHVCQKTPQHFAVTELLRQQVHAYEEMSQLTTKDRHVI